MYQQGDSRGVLGMELTPVFTVEDTITVLFCSIDDALKDVGIVERFDV